MDAFIVIVFSRGKRDEGEEPVSKNQIQPGCGERRADAGRDGELVSRDQIFRREPGQIFFCFLSSGDQEQDWQPYPVDSYSMI